MKALVTGADGFIGSNLVSALLARGFEVRALVFPGSPSRNLDGLPVEICSGDLTRPETLLPAAAGVDYVFHLAAKVTDWGPLSEFRKVIVEGTGNILEASAASRVRRFLYVSTLAVHRYRDYIDGDENAPRDCRNLPYGVTKIEAEDRVRHFQKSGRLGTVIIRPGIFPFGPNDRTSFFPLAQAFEGGIFGFIRGGKKFLCTSYVENLVEGMILAALAPRAEGQTYILTDGIKVTWKELFELFTRHLGKKPLWINIPYPPVYLVALFWESLYRLFGVKTAPLLTRYRVSLQAYHLHFDCRKAREELGYRPLVDLEEGIRRTVAWYQKAKQINDLSRAESRDLRLTNDE
ncbi:MAG: NAD-dependent epimerase/dehydratase family protein [bacterium]|nr:NAD-dependent epimerase/dehydratase family protein [bacterium]